MIDDEYCALWAKIPAYRRREIGTQETIRKMLAVCKSPYIAFSCGKDSSVMADMILRINPKIKMRFISSGETRILHNVDEVMRYFKDKYNAEIEEINFDRVFSEEWKNATFDEQRKAGRRDIQTVDTTGYDCVFMGLRREESHAREISLKTHNTDGLPVGMYKYKNRDFYRCCPLSLWKTEDVGAYIVEHGIPTLDWYKTYGYTARTTARLTGDAVRQNVLFWLKIHNPKGYARLCQRFPEFNIYQ